MKLEPSNFGSVCEKYFLCYYLNYTERREIKNIVLSIKTKIRKCKLKKLAV